MVEKGKVIHKNDEYRKKKVDNAVDNDDFIHKNPMRWHVEKVDKSYPQLWTNLNF